MIHFPVHTLESAPTGAKDGLRNLQESVGFVPNLAAAMAESPELLNGFLAVRQYYEGGTFTPGEIQVLSLTAAFENACAWCMAFHTFMARNHGISAESVSALREGRSPRDPRLRALSDFARSMIRGRGNVGAEALQQFLDAGYTRAQALEVVLGMAFSLMANYAGHLVDAPVDPPFQAHAWHGAPVGAGDPA
jgi:AhpD family alkylhydroperoxidase